MDLEQARQTSEVTAEHPTLGRPDAAIELRYYSDFQCPHCRAFERSDAHKRLQEDHIEGGTTRLVFVPFPVLGEDSVRAAEAAHFVWRQAPEAYWAWHVAMYEAQREENSGWASLENVLKISRKVPGVDIEGLREALDSGKYRGRVESDREEAHERGVGSTPTLLLRDEPVDPMRIPDALDDTTRR